MFKLLLATDRPEVREAFGSIRDWDRLGFKEPRTAATADEAVDSLIHHHADAVAINLPPEEEQKLVRAMARPRWCLRPILHAADTQEEILRDVVELELLLSRTHADYSNDDCKEETMMQLSRHEFFRKVISGKETSAEHLRRYMRLLRSRMDPDRPCVMLRFHLPDEDGYLSDHWHYGPDRLEVAMRNIFGAELQGVRILVSVHDDGQITLLACPMLDAEVPEPEEMKRLVLDHAEWAIGHVRDYLNIEMEIESVITLNSLVDLTKDRTQE